MMREAKRLLRESIRQAILALSPAEREERSARAQARLLALPEFRAARTILAYSADETEVQTALLLQTILAAGKRLGLPRTLPGRRLQILRIGNAEGDLETGRFSFKEPRADLPELPLAELDLIVVPGRAFDARGRRLGRGGGYYDRFLASVPPRVCLAGLAFECQIVAELPVLPHDRGVDWVVTERRLFHTARPGLPAAGLSP